MAITAKKEFDNRLAVLHDAIDTLRAELLNFKKATTRSAALVDQGMDVVHALACIKGPKLRSDLAEALDGFEEHRHRMRIAILALGQEQGASLSEVGRQLGISRQLAARLAAEENAG